VGTDREDLEANLATSFDRDTLAVYADELQSLGDPRGELIALDLQIEAHADPASQTRRYRYAPAELVARRATLLETWLRALVPSDPTRGWIGDHVRFGFLDNLELGAHSTEERDRLLAILASPVGSYVRGVTIRGATSDLAKSLAVLARMQHPWLARLTLHKRAAGPTVPSDLEARIITATPRLSRLELSGHRAFDVFAHPALRELRIDGRASLASVATRAFAGVTLLDLAFGSQDDEPVYLPEEDEAAGPDDAGELAKLLTAELLPNLRRLDLSRNEPGPPVENYYDEDDVDIYGGLGNDFAPRVDPFELIGILPLRRQLTHLTLPSLRTEQDFTRLADAVAAMPALASVEVARGHYYRAPALPHATARFVRPPAWPWPPPASIHPGEALRIAVPGSQSGDLVGLADAVVVMESHFEELPADARYAWTRLWLFVGELELDREQRFPAEVLVDALESCELTGGWRELRDELRFRRPLPAGATVAVRRSLG
jgi:hypothetical protein